jgi:hypothetical protein
MCVLVIFFYDKSTYSISLIKMCSIQSGISTRIWTLAKDEAAKGVIRMNNLIYLSLYKLNTRVYIKKKRKKNFTMLNNSTKFCKVFFMWKQKVKNYQPLIWSLVQNQPDPNRVHAPTVKLRENQELLRHEIHIFFQPI